VEPATDVLGDARLRPESGAVPTELKRSEIENDPDGLGDPLHVVEEKMTDPRAEHVVVHCSQLLGENLGLAAFCVPSDCGVQYRRSGPG